MSGLWTALLVMIGGALGAVLRGLAEQGGTLMGTPPWCIILAVEASNTMVNAQAGELVAGSAAEQEAGCWEVGGGERQGRDGGRQRELETRWLFPTNP